MSNREMPIPQNRPQAQAKCHNPSCKASIEMPDSILQRARSYLHTTAMGVDSIAAVCDRCKVGYAYTIAEFYSSGKTDTPDPFRNGGLNLFHVYTKCGDKNCEFLTGVWSPKPGYVKKEDVQAELAAWKIDGVLGLCGGRALGSQPE